MLRIRELQRRKPAQAEMGVARLSTQAAVWGGSCFLPGPKPPLLPTSDFSGYGTGLEMGLWGQPDRGHGFGP